MSPQVCLLSPVPLDSPRGNSITVTRIAGSLRERGLDVCVRPADDIGFAEGAAPGRPAVVHAFHAYRTGPRGAAVAAASRVPLVITLTGTDVSDDLRDAERGRVVRQSLREAAAVTVFHDSVASEVLSVLPDLASRITVVPQSVVFPPKDANSPAPALTGEPCLLFPAGIRPVKRPLFPLDPLESLRREHPGLALWYAGPSLDARETQRLTQELSRRPWARNLGPVSHAVMPSLLSGADIVLNCSLSEGGMANAVLEAFALGRAVLASDIPGNRSLVEDGVTGLLFDSEAGLMRGAARLTGDPALRRRLGEAGRQLVESRYPPSRETDGYLSVYARVTGTLLG